MRKLNLLVVLMVILLPALTAASAAVSQEAELEKLEYGTRAGMHVTVTNISGLGTDRARINFSHTREDATAYCAEYVLKVTEQCISETLATPLAGFVSADCYSGVLTDAWGEGYRFKGPRFDQEESYELFDEQWQETTLPPVDYSMHVGLVELLCPPDAIVEIEEPFVEARGTLYRGVGIGQTRSEVEQALVTLGMRCVTASELKRFASFLPLIEARGAGDTCRVVPSETDFQNPTTANAFLDQMGLELGGTPVSTFLTFADGRVDRMWLWSEFFNANGLDLGQFASALVENYGLKLTPGSDSYSGTGPMGEQVQVAATLNGRRKVLVVSPPGSGATFD